MSDAAAGRATHPSGDERFVEIDEALDRARYAQDELIEVLHVVQDVFGYLSEDALRYLSHELRLPPSTVFGVATFYHLFSFEPPGAHTCTVCTGTACFVEGADEIVRQLETTYGVAPGATTDDGSFTLSTGRCVGPCAIAPVIVVDGVVRGHVSAASAQAAVDAAVHGDADDEGAPATREVVGQVSA